MSLRFIELIKPRITLLVLLTTSCGLLLAPQRPSAAIIFFTLVGVFFLVSSANSLNMYLERDIDALMKRTQNRPLPSRRLSPRAALIFGGSLALLGLGVLALRTNHLTAWLGLIAFVSYVLFYTPLKQKSHLALLVGAIPGALPPLIGWTSATGLISPLGMVLFFILFLWQIPHFIAIALSYHQEYAAAGIQTFPLVHGERSAKYLLLRYLIGLYAVTLYPVILGTHGLLYFSIAFPLGGLFLVYGLLGLAPRSTPGWSNKFFLISVIYLPLLLIALTVTSLY